MPQLSLQTIDDGLQVGSSPLSPFHSNIRLLRAQVHFCRIQTAMYHLKDLVTEAFPSFAIIRVALWCIFAIHLASTTPFHVTPSHDSYGPDGPWYAVQVGLGTPPQAINLYPIGSYQSIIYSKEICRQYQNVTCGAGGFFDGAATRTLDNDSIAAYIPYGHFDGSARSVLDTLTLSSGEAQSPQGINVPKFGIALFFRDNFTIPDGSVYPQQVGHLSLSPYLTQAFNKNGGASPAVNASLIPAPLEVDGIIDSTSFGLHWGSATFQMPLSLWLGGYDSSRVAGPVIAGPIVNRQNQIDLLDIGLGVDNGASPFPFPSKQGILPVTAPLTVAIDAQDPYLSLPFGICQTISQDLPVIFEPKYGLYLWNTSDPRYARIITSPSYLSFTFRAPALDQGNLTIKVPFQLLNLTLSSPLTSTPTAYFPCSTAPSSSVYTLGRAFLQAAWTGTNWSKKPAWEWYLAQAPGPNIPSSPSGIPYSDNVTGHAANWSETWKNNWTPLPDASGPSRTNSSAAAIPSTTAAATATKINPDPENLSPGAKAGAVVGSLAAAASVLGAAILLFRHWRRKAYLLSNATQPEGEATAHTPAAEIAVEHIYEAGDPEAIEMSQYPILSHEMHPNEVFEAPLYRTSL